jgi:hypothetical protein
LVTAAGVVASAALALVAMHVLNRSPEAQFAVDPSGGDGAAAAAQPNPDPSSAPTDLAGAMDGEATPLVRTDFSDDAAWQQVVALVTAPVDFNDPDNPDPGEDGYAPYIVTLEDRSLEGVTGAVLGKQAMAAGLMRGYALLADARSMAEARAGGEVTVEYVDLSPYAAEDAKLFHTFPGNSFRCAVAQVASIEANLSIDNLDFSDFARTVSPDGVYRG